MGFNQSTSIPSPSHPTWIDNDWIPHIYHQILLRTLRPSYTQFCVKTQVGRVIKFETINRIFHKTLIEKSGGIRVQEYILIHIICLHIAKNIYEIGSEVNIMRRYVQSFRDPNIIAQ